MPRLSKEEKARIGAERAEKARQHTEYVEQEFASEIEHSIANTKIYSPDSFDNAKIPTPRYESTKYIVSPWDSVSAAYMYAKEGKKTAILNFADFTRIGGKFMEGSSAQEECLCHESTLYSVQKAFKESYYEENARIKKRIEIPDLYTNRALYSGAVVFIHDGKIKTFDVITCASPNFYRGQRYHAIDSEKNDIALQERVRFVLQVARDNNVDVLLLGAFGCGVFSQNPERCATLFKEYLTTEFAGAFETVVFPIPAGRRSNKNHDKFHEVFSDV